MFSTRNCSRREFLVERLDLSADIQSSRIGRFILDALLAAGGHPWTVIRVERRKAYMESLENASVRHDIRDFPRFSSEEIAASAKLE